MIHITTVLVRSYTENCQVICVETTPIRLDFHLNDSVSITYVSRSHLRKFGKSFSNMKVNIKVSRDTLRRCHQTYPFSLLVLTEIHFNKTLKNSHLTFSFCSLYFSDQTDDFVSYFLILSIYLISLSIRILSNTLPSKTIGVHFLFFITVKRIFKLTPLLPLKSIRDIYVSLESVITLDSQRRDREEIKGKDVKDSTRVSEGPRYM